MMRIDGELHTKETGIPLMYRIISSYETDEIIKPTTSINRKSANTFKKTLILDSLKLQELGLRQGVNNIRYHVNSRIQGQKSLRGKIYL